MGMGWMELSTSQENAEAEGHTLDRQTRKITPQGAREVEKGSEAEARLPCRRQTLGKLYFFGCGAFRGGSGLEGYVRMGRKVGEDNEDGEDLERNAGGW
jgi:hypothetical protein